MRYAGSNLQLSDFDFSGITSNAGATASAGGKVAAAFNAARRNSGFRPAEIHSADIGLRSNQRQTAMGLDASFEANKINNEAELAAAKEIYGAQASNYRSQGNSAMLQGVVKGGLGLLAGVMSDERTKNNIEPLENALATLRQLKPVSFYYNKEYSDTPERKHHGFIAQEYKTVLPDATYVDESTQKLCIDTSDVIAILVRAVQQLEHRLTYLEAVNALQGAKV